MAQVAAWAEVLARDGFIGAFGPVAVPALSQTSSLIEYAVTCIFGYASKVDYRAEDGGFQ